MRTNESNGSMNTGTGTLTLNHGYDHSNSFQGLTHGTPSPHVFGHIVGFANSTQPRDIVQGYVSTDAIYGPAYSLPTQTMTNGFAPSAVPFALTPAPSAFNSRVLGNGFDRAAVYCPAVCVTENNQCFSVSCELPGVSDKDIDVIWHNGTLSIRGQKRNKDLDSNTEVCVSDQVHGQFYRAVCLSHVENCVDTNKITTKHVNGVLEVTLPKVRQSTGSYIKVGSTK